MIPEEIRTVLRDEINPKLGACGGWITPLSYEDGVLTVRMGGKCRGCLAVDQTIHDLVEGTLRARCAEHPVKQVVLSDQVDPDLMAQAMKILSESKRRRN